MKMTARRCVSVRLTMVVTRARPSCVRATWSTVMTPHRVAASVHVVLEVRSAVTVSPVNPRPKMDQFGVSKMYVRLGVWRWQKGRVTLQVLPRVGVHHGTIRVLHCHVMMEEVD